MTSFPITKRKRATRAKFAKVRTGCVTCKKRHVKCDETKPACRNCIKWAGFCGGYEPIHTQPKGAAVKKNLIALPSVDMDVTSSPEELEITLNDYDYFWQMHTPETLSPPTSIDSQTGPLGLYQSYASQPDVPPPFTTVKSTAKFNSSFWDYTLPYLIESNAAIRFANLAVHALVFAKSPDLALDNNQVAQDYYGEALMCYGMALQEIMKATAGRANLREAIVCCIFFVIFETLNEDREASQAHLRSGQKLLGELDPECNEAEDFSAELRNVLRYLGQQAREPGPYGSNPFAADERASVLESLVF